MDGKEKEIEIDLAKLGRIMWGKKKQVLALCVAGAAIGFAYPMTRPAVYTSSAMIQIRSDVGVAALSEAIAQSGEMRSGNNIMGIVEQLRSPAVLEETVKNLPAEEGKDKAVLSAAIAKGLKVENIQKTDLIRITAQGNTPQEAQKFAQGITDSFISLHNSKNQDVQARKAEFLTKQVAEAKQAVATADEKLISAPKNESNQEYRQLERDAKIKEDIYANLVKEQEASKIRQQMNSEEIQIVSPANLPTTESGPRTKKKQYAAVGLVLGALISLGYGLLCYRKEN